MMELAGRSGSPSTGTSSTSSRGSYEHGPCRRSALPRHQLLRSAASGSCDHCERNGAKQRGSACEKGGVRRGCGFRRRTPERRGESGRARELTATRAGFSAFLLCAERQSTGRATRGPLRAKTSCRPSTGTHRARWRLCITRPARARAKGRDRASGTCEHVFRNASQAGRTRSSTPPLV